MAYDPTIPDPDHYIEDDIPAIRANFAELGPLVPHIATLVDLTALQPHVAELVDLTALQPHIAALLSSRVVDTNISVPNPPNGWYVIYEDGWKKCVTVIQATRLTDSTLRATWNYPVEFEQLAIPTFSINTHADFTNLPSIRRPHLVTGINRAPNQNLTSTYIDVYRIEGTPNFSEGDYITVFACAEGI